MRHVYQHTYRDGAKITLVAEITEGGTFTLLANPRKVEKHHEAEYTQWRDEVVAPDLSERVAEAFFGEATS